MCEFLVQIKDTSLDPTVAAPRAGDVIVIEDDGHAWGDKELAGRLLIKRPGQPKEALANLLGRKVPHGHAPAFRAFYLDLQSMEVRRRETVAFVVGD